MNVYIMWACSKQCYGSVKSSSLYKEQNLRIFVSMNMRAEFKFQLILFYSLFALKKGMNLFSSSYQLNISGDWTLLSWIATSLGGKLSTWWKIILKNMWHPFIMTLFWKGKTACHKTQGRLFRDLWHTMWYFSHKFFWKMCLVLQKISPLQLNHPHW